VEPKNYHHDCSRSLKSWTKKPNLQQSTLIDKAAPSVHPAKARRIAANIARLPELLSRKDYGLSAAGADVASVGPDIVNAHLVL
jgi:hypothetical protein